MKRNELPRKELLIVEIRHDDDMSWKELRTRIRLGIKETEGAKFVEISTWSVPNRYDLTDPDVIPEGFK